MVISPDYSLLDRAGLNLQAVLDIACLPPEIRTGLAYGERHRRLILIGNGGRLLWEKVSAAGATGSDPVDDFSREAFCAWCRAQIPGAAVEVLYPGTGLSALPGLQSLGRFVGWHHASPLGVGINRRWGMWFAYRIVALTDAELAPTPVWNEPSPCRDCVARPCLAACPAHAPGACGFALQRCIDYRLAPESHCRASCLSRLACPVAAEHRYDDAQLAHSYGRSLETLRDWLNRQPSPTTNREG